MCFVPLLPLPSSMGGRWVGAGWARGSSGRCWARLPALLVMERDAKPENIGAVSPSKPQMTDQTDDRRTRRMARKNTSTCLALLRIAADSLDVAAHECPDGFAPVGLDTLSARVGALRASIPGQSEGFYVLKAIGEVLRAAADEGSAELERQALEVILRGGGPDPEAPVVTRAPLRLIDPDE